MKFRISSVLQSILPISSLILYLMKMQTSLPLGPCAAKSMSSWLPGAGKRGAAAGASAATMAVARADHHKDAPAASKAMVSPPVTENRILLSVKLGMIAKKIGDKELTLTERLLMAKEG